MRCIRESIFDVVFDIDKDLIIFGNWIASNLAASDNSQLYIDTRLAHGFQTLQDQSEVEYSHSVPYSPEYSAGIKAVLSV
jgi:dTDP-4-dehydrorhamnose 3,5-epimerase